jgi:hypothetical protein
MELGANLARAVAAASAFAIGVLNLASDSGGSVA